MASRGYARNRTLTMVAGITVVTGAVLVLATAALAGCSLGTTSTTAPLPAGTGYPTSATSAGSAPDFSGVTLDGVDVSLSEYRGKPLVLAFMASW
jgi:cytochrome oxidase Cu insertion factor (SCO1/SenC/PrrC family)